MLDKYFCKRLHAKKITLDMAVDYIIYHPIFMECACIYIIFTIAVAIMSIAKYGFIATMLPPVCLGVVCASILALFRHFIAPKIQVASCPLTKTRGKL